MIVVKVVLYGDDCITFVEFIVLTVKWNSLLPQEKDPPPRFKTPKHSIKQRRHNEIS